MGYYFFCQPARVKFERDVVYFSVCTRDYIAGSRARVILIYVEDQMRSQKCEDQMRGQDCEVHYDV